MDKTMLRLYVMGKTPRSELAITNIKRISEVLEDMISVNIIDVLEDPERAETDRILATPTLIREDSMTYRRVIGDMSDIPRLLSWLDLEKFTDLFLTEEGEEHGN